MKNEVYLYGSKGGGNDAAGDCMMIPASRAYGIVPQNSIDIRYVFAPMDNTSTTGDVFLFRDANAAGGNTLYNFAKKVVESQAAARVTGNNFVVLFDEEPSLPTNEGPISSDGVAAGIDGNLIIT